MTLQNNEEEIRILNRCHGFEYIGESLWRAIPAKDKLNPEEAYRLLSAIFHKKLLVGKIEELKNVGGVNDAYETIGHLKANNVKDRIKALTQELEGGKL